MKCSTDEKLKQNLAVVDGGVVRVVPRNTATDHRQQLLEMLGWVES